MEDPVVLLVHLDYGESEHAYTLYQVPESQIEKARAAIQEAWDDYEASGRNGEWDGLAENAIKASGVPYAVLAYDPLLIEP